MTQPMAQTVASGATQVPTHPRLFNADIAVVTGAGQGIGLSVARGLGQAGARVVLVDIDADRVAAAAATLAAEGITCWARQTDITASAA